MYVTAPRIAQGLHRGPV